MFPGRAGAMQGPLAAVLWNSRFEDRRCGAAGFHALNARIYTHSKPPALGTISFENGTFQENCSPTSPFDIPCSLFDIPYAPWSAYQPKTTRPMAMGVKMAMMMIQGTGLPMSPFTWLMFIAALYT